MAKDAFFINIIGDRKVNRRFLRLELNIQTRILSKSFLQIAGNIRDDIRQNIRSLGLIKTGKMLKSIKRRRWKRRSKFKVGFTVQAGTRAELGLPSSKGNYYPLLLERGTNKMSAKPFMRPGFQRNASGALRKISRDMNAGIKREWSKG